MTTDQSAPAHLPELERAWSELFCLEDEEASELLLIRHGEPEESSVSATASDPPLSLRGRRQASVLASRLQQYWIEAIYAGPELRTVETAKTISSALDRPATSEPGLGDIRVLLQPYLDSVSLAAAFMSMPRWDSVAALESSREFRQRVLQAVDAIIARHPARRVAVVTHAAVINAYLSVLLEIPRDMFFLPEYTSVTVVRNLRDLTAVVTVNDFTHLSLAERGVAK